MANEATLIIETELPIGFTCANGTGIEKGSVLKIADPFTASSAGTLGDLVAGIAATEKIASDGKVKIATYRHGIFKMTLSGAAAVGEALIAATANKVSRNNSVLSGVRILGTALETGADGETILVDLNPSMNVTL